MKKLNLLENLKADIAQRMADLEKLVPPKSMTDAQMQYVLKQAYQDGLQKFWEQVKPDQVYVVRALPKLDQASYEDTYSEAYGFQDRWDSYMDTFVGRVFEISEKDRKGIMAKNNKWIWPYYALELQEPKPKPILGVFADENDQVNVKKDGYPDVNILYGPSEDEVRVSFHGTITI